MAQAKLNDKVRVHYTGTLEDGTVFDTSVEREPLEFTLGQQQVIQGFEAVVIGMDVGDKRTQQIPAEEAYGPFQDALVEEIDRSHFPDDADIAVGQQFRAAAPDGRNMVLTVVNVAGDTVTVDGNHPLAGKDLKFEIELVEIV
ncbi:MAG: peptidylprolyl isomerase [bacterium]|nr:peptidylprolyl isomerase [bacterium]